MVETDCRLEPRLAFKVPVEVNRTRMMAKIRISEMRISIRVKPDFNLGIKLILAGDIKRS